MSERRPRFSGQQYITPFGRFEAGSGAEPPANQVLIGREKQRAYFIDILLRAGRKGAFLVTGHRGVGKSSFVRYCLKEYEQEVFDRALRSNVGRSFYWDRIFLLLLAFVVPMFLLMVSQLMDLLVRAALAARAPGAMDSPNFLLGVVVVPPLIVCLYPLLYGWEVLSVAWRARPQWKSPTLSKWRIARFFQQIASPKKHGDGASIVVLFLTILVVLACWSLPPFGAPAVTISRLFCALCGTFLFVRSTSFQPPRNLTDEEREGLKEDAAEFQAMQLRYGYWHSFVGSPWLLMAVGLFPFVLGARSLYWIPLLSAEKFESSEAYSGNVLAGFALFGAGLVLQSFHQSRLQGDAARMQSDSIRARFVVGALMALVALAFLASRRDSTILWASTLVLVAGGGLLYVTNLYVYRRWWREHRKVEAFSGALDDAPLFRPRPNLALTIKAVICVVIGLHLVDPVARPLVSKLAAKFPLPYAEPLSAIACQVNNLLADDLCVADLNAQGMLPIRCAAPLLLATNSTEYKFDPNGPPESLFRGRAEENLWVKGVFLIVLVLFFLDYEWVLAPFQKGRRDEEIDPEGPRHDLVRPVQDRGREALVHLAKVTLPRMLYSSWLPMITVSVNLGFERLDHRRVVQAMLVGLREQYRRKFLAWNSVLANLGRLVLVVSLLALVNLAGERWFALPALGSQDMLQVRQEANRHYEKICSILAGAQTSPSAAHLICSLEWGDKIRRTLYFNVLQVESGVDQVFEKGRDHLVFLLFPYQNSDWPAEEYRTSGQVVAPPLMRAGIHFRVYHVVLFALGLFLSRTLLRRVPVLPYRDVVKRIDSLLESLTGSTSSTSRMGRWPLTKWLEGFPLGEEVRQTQHEPFDPRTVEFEFLQILHEIQDAAFDLPGASSQRVSLPVPEVTFFFDELDKLGTRVEPASEGGVEPQQAEILDAERRRSLELHKLLADMKNLLSVAPARFIFVGGRNLHDEWLADQTSRLPLLTSIFHSEVYLSSLLTDRRERIDAERLPERIEQFVIAQLKRAQVQFEQHRRRLWVPPYALRIEEQRDETFVDARDFECVRGGGAQLANMCNVVVYSVDHAAGQESIAPIHGQEQLLRDFLQFLTYRSLGNPKRLRELIAWFIRPVGRYIGQRRLRDTSLHCDHVLLFDEVERLRIQLLARIYRHVNFTFDQGFSRIDDKMTVSIFHLSDFLLKFHRRAFSWSSLERVEDMVQIHRAPDLREVMETMVEQWSERFLHRIRNGMYDFRFRSELAREIEYISRLSPAEMAAFNFTLDESRSLKSIYETTIRKLKDGSGRELQDFVSGLGELHEFDQEFETARVHYRQAISLIDSEFRAITGGSEWLEKSSPMMQVFAGWRPGPDHARLYLTWGVARLRLMLQVGMTFEVERNHERASVEYDNASALARAILLALLDSDGRYLSVAAGAAHRGGVVGESRLDVLKHLNILFQPVFAGAWVAEKLIGAVDTSTTLVETTLWELRVMLPFVREVSVSTAAGPVSVGHANFGLIAAEIHNKAGDLYFLKGRQLTSLQAVRVQVKGSQFPRHGEEGYLLRAHYHYAVGLHELRRFTAYRRWSSANKLNIRPAESFEDGKIRETLEREGWPDFVFRSLGGTLNDFGEVMLGRVSLFGLLRALQGNSMPRCRDRREKAQQESTRDLVSATTRWMELLSDSSGDAWTCQEDVDKVVSHRILVPLGDQILDCGSLGGWFGRWNSRRDAHDKNARIVEFNEWEQHDDLERLAVALNFMLVGGKFLEKGGYVEDAAREFLKVSEIATTYLWWSETVRHLVSWKSRPAGKLRLRYEVLEAIDPVYTNDVRDHAFWRYLRQIALYGLEKADRLFRRARQAKDLNVYLVGDKVPVECLIGACSLGLVEKLVDSSGSAVIAGRERGSTNINLASLIRSWLGPESGGFMGTQSCYRERLVQTLERHSYPMLARLQGLKVLIDHDILSEPTLVSRSELIRWEHELYDLTERFNSPLHFTPMHSGTTYALVYLYFFGACGCECTGELEIIRRTAQRALMRSEEMFTLRRAFYESISDLFYLYDDFNDREVHFNHALQMAGSELTSLLRYLVSIPDAEG